MPSRESAGQLAAPDHSPGHLALGTAISSEPGSFPERWISGTDSVNDPPLQVHAYNDDFYILRQSMCLNYEGPFLYLIFGKTSAILFDTGATGDPPLAETVMALIEAWKTRHGVATVKLIVAHTHGHGDHVANDHQFAGLPDTTILGTSLDALKTAYALPDWPHGIGQLDLGDRVLDILPTPGHHATHITIYDRRTGILLTGDTFYAGFLFISSFTEYRKSIQKLVEFTEGRKLSWILGAHIEMTNTPSEIYPYGTEQQPSERALPLERKHLLELNKALAAMGDEPDSEVHDDFIITP